METYVTSWGNINKVKANLLTPQNVSELKIMNYNYPTIAYGNGRSYGDSALFNNIISMNKLNYFIDFDIQSGVLTCDGGILLADILEIFVPKGYFLPVTPGTKFVTLGGAIDSDVHGKNHHAVGSISEFIISFDLWIGNQTITCSETENSDLFYATCGGMGLTGIIVRVKIKLLKISGNTIKQTTIKAKNIQEIIELFFKYQDVAYSVAWIDCVKSGDNFGRSILMLGEHCDKNINIITKQKSLPFNLLSYGLNKLSIKLFNELYYNIPRKKEGIIHYNKFFYPLDSFKNWNLVYGNKGLRQYQFVLPIDTSQEGIKHILKEINKYGEGSFLAVLKMFGKENNNLLSFPTKGLTLALDFKNKPTSINFFHKLDKIVLDYGGRVYLAKDSCLNINTFKQMYAKNLQEFQRVRQKYKLEELFKSYQSQRLGI